MHELGKGMLRPTGSSIGQQSSVLVSNIRIWKGERGIMREETRVNTKFTYLDLTRDPRVALENVFPCKRHLSTQEIAGDYQKEYCRCVLLYPLTDLNAVGSPHAVVRPCCFVLHVLIFLVFGVNFLHHVLERLEYCSDLS